MNVYIVDADNFIPDEAAVSPYRLENANRFRHEAGRMLSLAASKALDAALSEFGLREKDMAYAEGIKGKPEFTNSHLYFSLSHSGHYACAAVSEAPVGLDLQMISKYDARVAKRCFGPDELRTLETVPDADTEFTRLWVRHESAVKLTGEGLAGMQTVDLSKYCLSLSELPDATICVCTERPCEVRFICL